MASLLAAGAARLPVVVVGGVSLVPMLLSVCCLEAAGQLMSRVQLTAAAEGGHKACTVGTRSWGGG